MDMTEPDYTLSAYVEDLKRITAEETDEKAIFKRLAPLAQKLAATPGWVTDTYRQCDEEQGFGVHVLHEEDDHANAVFVVSWLPNRGTPPHDHGAWAVVANDARLELRTRVALSGLGLFVAASLILVSTRFSVCRVLRQRR